MRNDKTEAIVARMAAVKEEIDASFVLLAGGECVLRGACTRANKEESERVGWLPLTTSVLKLH